MPITLLSIFKLTNTYMTTTEGDKILVLDLDSHKNVAGWSRLMIPFLISWEGQRQHRHKHIDIYIRSPENSTKYVVLLIARVQMLFTFLSVLFVASNTLASLSSPSTNAWMDTGVTLQKRHSFREPALQTVWPQSRGFQQNANPHHWTELSVEWFSTWESGKILD